MSQSKPGESKWFDPREVDVVNYRQKRVAQVVHRVLPDLSRSLRKSLAPALRAVSPGRYRWHNVLTSHLCVLLVREPAQGPPNLGRLLRESGVPESPEIIAFSEAFKSWTQRWHLYEGWQHRAALHGIGSLASGDKYDDLVLLPWIGESYTDIYAEFDPVGPYIWRPTEDTWAQFRKRVLDITRESLDHFKTKAEQHFRSSHLQRTSSTRAGIPGPDTDRDFEILALYQIGGWTRMEIIDAVYGDELKKLSGSGKKARIRSLKREISRIVGEMAGLLDIQMVRNRPVPTQRGVTESAAPEDT